jgi:hypothetical protein
VALFPVDEGGFRSEVSASYKLKVAMQMEEHELLRQGFNPAQIIALRASSKLKFH